jgi:hypothetical protein
MKGYMHGLGEVTTGCRELSLRTAEVLQKQVGQTGTGSSYLNGVPQAFIVGRSQI